MNSFIVLVREAKWGTDRYVNTDEMQADGPIPYSSLKSVQSTK
jgi:hypothetical protein